MAKCLSSASSLAFSVRLCLRGRPLLVRGRVPPLPLRHASSSVMGGKAVVSSMLQANQILELDQVAGAVQSYDQNWHPANDPIEDSHAQAVLPHREDCMLFAVVDGHAGGESGRVVSERLFSYVSAGLLSQQQLKTHYQARKEGDRESEFFDVVEQSSSRETNLPSHVEQIYEENYLR